MIICIGYIGEDGFEIFIFVSDVVIFCEFSCNIVYVFFGDGFVVWWVGFVVRDFFCLEVGMCLYGYDIDEYMMFLMVGLIWVVGKCC